MSGRPEFAVDADVPTSLPGRDQASGLLSTTSGLPPLAAEPCSVANGRSVPTLDLRIRGDLCRKVLSILADAEEEGGLPFVQPRQTEKVQARHASGAAEMLRPRAVCKDRQANPGKVAARPVRP